MFTLFKNGFSFFFILTSSLLFAQQENSNQVDANGKRHGKWTKYFEGTEQIRYTGEFNHGQEVGTFIGSHTVNTTNLSSGIYTVLVQTGNNKIARLLVKE